MRRPLLALTAVAASLLAAAPAQAIVGGQDASRPYPYMGALLIDGAFSCGASLVAPGWALTAAHCAVDGNGDPAPPQTFAVLLGSQTLSGSGERLKAVEVHVHPSYGKGPHPDSFDVALLRLERDSAQTPVALANPATQRSLWAPGARATVTGWGATDGFTGGSTDRLQEVDVPIVSDSHCEMTQVITGFEPTTQVCAGELYGTKDSCQGDSGGPLVVSDGRGGLLQIGVVSFGFNCGLPTQYGVYARVGDRPLHGWISEKIAPPPPPPVTAPAPGQSTVKPAQPWTKPRPAKRKTVTCKRSKRTKRCTCPKGYRRSKAKGSRRCVKITRSKKSARRR